MALTRVVEVIQRAHTLLQDMTSVRWPLLELQGWLNDAYKELVLYRPDEYTRTSVVTLAPGTRQRAMDAPINLPNIQRVMKVVRNMGEGSNRRAIRYIDQQILDDQHPDWHTHAPSTSIQHFMFDPLVPREFFVYPPAAAGTQVELMYALVPEPHTLTEAQLRTPTTTETIRVSDSFANALVDYILYRAWSKDAEYAANSNRAVAHYTAFTNALGAKTASDTASSPAATTGRGERGV